MVQRGTALAEEAATGSAGDGELGRVDEVRGVETLTVLGRQVQRCVQLCSELSSHLKRALEVDAGYSGEPEEAQQWLMLPY